MLLTDLMYSKNIISWTFPNGAFDGLRHFTIEAQWATLATTLCHLLKGFSIDTSGLLMHTELNATCNDGSNVIKLSKPLPTYSIKWGTLTTLVISRGKLQWTRWGEVIVYLFSNWLRVLLMAVLLINTVRNTDWGQVISDFRTANAIPRNAGLELVYGCVY